MVGVAPDEGGGRRLPQWMVGASGNDQLGKSDNTKAKKNNGLSSEASDFDQKTKKTPRVKESSHILTKCGAKRSKGKEKREDADSDFSISVDLAPPEKKRNRARSRKSIEESKIQPLNENDDEDVDELTVEDLMTIAKEYVRENKTSELDQASKRKCEQSDRSTTTVLSRNESTTNNGARICNVTTNTDDTRSSAVFSKSKSILTEETVISTSGTGDPAQEMLDLFLGPLLRKPGNETKRDVLSDDVAFYREFGVQNKTNTVKDDLAPPVTKKKSSLKDKIAMFLD